MPTSAEWENRALSAAASILEVAHVPLSPVTETNVIRLMAVAWLHGTQAEAERSLDYVDDAIAEIQVRLS